MNTLFYRLHDRVYSSSKDAPSRQHSGRRSSIVVDAMAWLVQQDLQRERTQPVVLEGYQPLKFAYKVVLVIRQTLL